MLPVVPPVVLPGLGVFAALICDVGDVPSSIEVVVYTPDRMEVLRASMLLNEATRPHADDLTKMIYATHLKVSPLPILAAGLIEIMIETEQGSLRAGRLQVRVDAGAPVEGGPPASSSPPAAVRRSTPRVRTRRPST